jgi:hypothetical protein
MKQSNVNWDAYTIKEHLSQVHYWLDRFDISRDIDHLDNAERFGEAVQPYLPACFRNLTLQGLYNLYLTFCASIQSDYSGGVE